MYLHTHTHTNTHTHETIYIITKLVEQGGMGDNTSKNKLFSQLASAVVVLKGYVEFAIYKC